MNNHIVTSATAHALKESGYPQPTPESGQHWYDFQGSAFVVTSKAPYLRMVSLQTGNGFSISAIQVPEMMTYAPTATEILQQPEMDDRHVDYDPEMHTWRIFDLSIGRNGAPYSNAAECAAAEYLKLKQP